MDPDFLPPWYTGEERMLLYSNDPKDEIPSVEVEYLTLFILVGFGRALCPMPNALHCPK